MPTLNCDRIKDSLGEFWQSVVDCAKKPNGGFAFTVPMNYPDGWQVSVEISPLTEKQVLLSDGGRTLARFFESGQNCGTSAKVTHALLKNRLELHGIQQDGLELCKSVSMPPTGEDLHVFAEALVGVAYLEYRHEPLAAHSGPVSHSVRKILRDRRVVAAEDIKISGVISSQIEIDFYIDAKTPIAIQPINRGGRIKDLMEQWGFRWNDLRSLHETLLPVMIYDADKPAIDAQSKEIGKKVCKLFCPYQEIYRLGELIDDVRKAGGFSKRKTN